MDMDIIAPIAGNRKVSDTVYLIKCEQFFKVGVTWDLRTRLSEMQTGNPFKLQLVDYFQSSNAFKDEKSLHLYLRKYHHHGEWFQLPMRLIKSRADWFFTTSPPLEDIENTSTKRYAQLSLRSESEEFSELSKGKRLATLENCLPKILELSEKLGWVKAGDLVRTRSRKGLNCKQIREWFKYLESEGVGEIRGEGRHLEFKGFPCAD